MIWTRCNRAIAYEITATSLRLGQLRLPVQDVDAVVVGGVLLGGVVADGPAVGSVVIQGEC